MFKNLFFSIPCSKFANEKFVIVNSKMDIISRLKLFLEQNGISNSQFADTCEIPRPTLSQLLNGRNKKVSDEVISKIHVAYPALNIMWLMFGDGEMFVSQASGLTENAGAQNLSKTPQSGTDFLGGKPVRSQRTISFSDGAQAPGNGGAAALSDAIQSIAKNVSRGSHPSPTGQRQIVNIMIFYDDNSFESITPMR
ncbi:MAG: helix-turn-helix transcriptional regulator [Muribaculaceae bacterium]|nr:helix-turn-helix transcriptional regulator [Muribaculaceae bacterium]